MKNLFRFSMLLGLLAWPFASSLPAQSHLPAAEAGISFFSGSYAEALAKAKAEGKTVFVDVYASWCGPCKRMKATSFQDKAVGDYFNAHFINFAVDGEKGEGPVLAKQFGVRAYPSLFFVAADGKVLQKTVGFQSPQNLLKIAKNTFQN
jgi:thiol:disulfide interchange protein